LHKLQAKMAQTDNSRQYTHIAAAVTRDYM